MDEIIQTQEPIRIAFAGGGTGGHLMPGVALADALCEIESDTRCLFLHASRDSRRTYGDVLDRFSTACLPDLRWQSLSQKLRFGPDSVAALADTLEAFARFAPHAVVGLGGSGCVIPVAAARALNVPTMLLESNAIPGAAVKLLAPWVDSVQAQWPATARRLRGARCRLNGIPVRQRIFQGDRATALKRFGLSKHRVTLLAMGGSQGALSLNRTLLDTLRDFPLPREKLQVLHLTGRRHLAEAHMFEAPEGLLYRPMGYLDDMESAYAAADLVLCRAGGSTLAELTALGRPAVLVPYPHATDDHQMANADALADRGAARCIAESDMSTGRLGSLLTTLLENPRSLKRMGKCARKMGYPAAARTIARELRSMTRKGCTESMGNTGEGYSQNDVSHAA